MEIWWLVCWLLRETNSSLQARTLPWTHGDMMIGLLTPKGDTCLPAGTNLGSLCRPWANNLLRIDYRTDDSQVCKTLCSSPPRTCQPSQILARHTKSTAGYYSVQNRMATQLYGVLLNNNYQQLHDKSPLDLIKLLVFMMFSASNSTTNGLWVVG